jgi:undecaprenyl-diphosphatase
LEYLVAVALGVVQGLTEFLPISSSAHLILARAFFDWNVDALGLVFDIATHIGTLTAVLWFFSDDLWPMVSAVPQAVTGGSGHHPRLVRLVIAGTVPIVVFGLLAGDWLETLRDPRVCAATLAIGATGMMIAERVRPNPRRGQDLTIAEAFLIGCGQAAALFPGMSRSGTTITLAMLLGIRREAAARFTFLMSIPAVLAVAGKQALDVAETGFSATDAELWVVGAVSAGVTGYLSIKFLIRYLADHSLDVFAYYRFALAAAVVIWLAR